MIRIAILGAGAMGSLFGARLAQAGHIVTLIDVNDAQILRAEGAKQAAILEAEGEREAAFRNAEAREREAEAEAKATQMVSQAIAAGDIQAINYFVAQKYTETLGAIGKANNSKIVLMPMEASSLIGSLGGIGAIAREVFGGDGGDRPRTVVPQRPAVPTFPARPAPTTVPGYVPPRPEDER